MRRPHAGLLHSKLRPPTHHASCLHRGRPRQPQHVDRLRRHCVATTLSFCRSPPRLGLVKGVIGLGADCAATRPMEKMSHAQPVARSKMAQRLARAPPSSVQTGQEIRAQSLPAGTLSRPKVRLPPGLEHVVPQPGKNEREMELVLREDRRKQKEGVTVHRPPLGLERVVPRPGMTEEQISRMLLGAERAVGGSDA
jgi:hypothetical protein